MAFFSISDFVVQFGNLHKSFYSQRFTFVSNLMSGLRKFNLKKIGFVSVTVGFCLLITRINAASHTPSPQFYHNLTSDTIPLRPKSRTGTTVPADTLPRAATTGGADSLRLRDTLPGQVQVDTFSIRQSKDTLDAPVNYEAQDSAVILVRDKRILLYGRTKTTYQDITLTAPRVMIDQRTDVVTAYNSRDSLGNVDARAVFSRGSESFQSDTITYNFKTRRGLTQRTYTKTTDMWVQGDLIKKVNDSTSFARGVVMTTCNYDEPHFGFKTKRAKFINNKVAITGPIHPEFEGVPIPFYLPFGFFPLNPGRHSGLLPPQFVVNQQFGLGLEGLGYYHVINDYWDVTLRTNIYSYGSVNLNLAPTYRKRYRYNGSLNLSYQRSKVAFKGDPDFSLSKTFNVAWSHNTDPRAKPGVTFGANVNAGSTRFNQFLPNNPIRNVTNTQTSSINYSKTWIGKPFNLTLAANQTQNSNNHLMNITLPDAGFTVTTLYPFQRAVQIGSKRWYENIGIGYNGILRNQVAFYDTAANTFSSILDTLQWGVQHRFPLTMALPPIAGGRVILSPGISYEETWLPNRIRRRWNPGADKIDTVSIQKGFFTDRQLNFSLTANTQIFGTFNFKRGRLMAIRHVIRPTVGFSYRPNLSRNKYDLIQVNNNKALPYSQFENNLFSGYGYGTFGGMTFAIDNNLEMKVRSKKDTGDAAVKKVRLIDGFGIQGSFNYLKDTQKLDPLNLYIRSTLFEKVNITATAILNPYQVNRLGQSINRYAWQDGFSLGTITNVSVAISTQFRSEPRDPNQGPNPNAQLARRMAVDPALAADQQRLLDFAARNPAEFVDFNIPWSLDLSFSLSYTKTSYDTIAQRFLSNLEAGSSFNGSFSLTPKWNFTTNGFYDFKTKQVTTLTMSINRDMHCWQMAIGLTPFGNFRNFSITISPKSAILQDLRINRTRTFVNY
jgi:LPS-assembly protein